MSERLAKMFAEPSEDAGPDWSDREAVIAYYLDGERAFAGSIPLDEPRLRRIIGRAYDRSPDMSAAQNHWMLQGAEPVRDRLGEIRVPALVLHGTEDPLFPYGHGEALAREIPGAKLLPLPGVGHQMPPPQTWNTAVPAILAL
ncbi:alpha/beta hydrolase [Streptomyces sp. LHD-70]|uniref:alpha/beta fold hydrolase n=1 Tax=Streptomyces sp. LHD-70 TaxID=3072140 RepID=UPI00280FFDFB|nr:alpha/beta hydrolase [Streptomyces sp. LHD-70]MDQ8707916.1 alpha/beta hydrolase [Streptomyces sp. LHD-70]